MISTNITSARARLTRSKRTLAVLACTTALGVLAACGGSSSSGVDGATPDQMSAAVELVKTTLLTTSDFGGDFVDSGSSTNTAKALPCGDKSSKSLDQYLAPGVDASVTLDSKVLAAEFTEHIKVYDNAGQAADALAYVTKGFNCTSGTLYADNDASLAITIAPAQDVTAGSGVEGVTSVMVWSFTSTQISGMVVAAEYGASLVLLTFSSQIGVDSTNLPDPGQITKAALTKIAKA
jgi:hypothetical protein